MILESDKIKLYEATYNVYKSYTDSMEKDIYVLLANPNTYHNYNIRISYLFYLASIELHSFLIAKDHIDDSGDMIEDYISFTYENDTKTNYNTINTEEFQYYLYEFINKKIIDNNVNYGDIIDPRLEKIYRSNTKIPERKLKILNIF